MILFALLVRQHTHKNVPTAGHLLNHLLLVLLRFRLVNHEKIVTRSLLLDVPSQRVLVLLAELARDGGEDIDCGGSLTAAYLTSRLELPLHLMLEVVSAAAGDARLLHALLLIGPGRQGRLSSSGGLLG